MTIKLFYSPGSCSLSPHIALREAGLSFELEAVDLAAKKLKKDGTDYLAINPKGYVPAVQLENGQVITEGAVIVQWIADQKPAAHLAPAAGTLERVRLQEWLHFIATELHKGFGPVNNARSNDEIRQFYKQRLTTRFEVLARTVQDQTYLLGDTFTVADGYAFYVLRNWKKLEASVLDRYSGLKRYFERLAERPAVKAALAAEGLS